MRRIICWLGRLMYKNSPKEDWRCFSSDKKELRALVLGWLGHADLLTRTQATARALEIIENLN